MEPEGAGRRLAAIMFTDIVGYTALMAESEEKGLRVRERHRALVRPLVERYHGESIEARGDESLSVFPSALDAVNCALAIQDELQSAADLKLHLGIHLGDIVLQGSEVSGDGVNIASRICSLSEGGGLCVSGEVYQSVRNQPNIEAAPLGEHELKNVGRPVAAFALTGTASLPRPISAVRRRRRARPALWAPVVAAAVGVAPVVWWLNWGPTDLAPIRSIAVLPLENLSGNPEQDYFADGMTEALIGDLAKISGLRVISRTSVMQYKGARKPLPEIAQELGVDGVVEGTVMRAGNRVRITAQLIRAATDEHLWAESYERELQDVLVLQAEVARSVASELRVKLTAEERVQLDVADRVDPKAQELYLKGRVTMSQDYYDLHESVEFYEAAIKRDPRFARAHAALAEAYVLLAETNLLSPREAYPRAEGAATRAIELDPTLSDAHAALGLVALSGWDWELADRELTRAIELSPNSASPRRYRSWYLYALGRIDESIAEIERAVSLDPLYVGYHLDLAAMTAAARDDERTRRQALEFLEMGWPDSTTWWARVQLALVLARQSSPGEAIAELERARTAAGGKTQPEAVIASALAVAGRQDEARRLLRELDERSTREYVSPFWLALAYGHLGETDLAFARLDRAFDGRDVWLPYLNGEPLADPLRSDPRFRDLLRRMNYPGAS